ncbi:glycerol-3-phosphate dehydrogenase [NAD(P)+] [Iodidimonas gelatinilytica]|uniref:Glycerol-3-phosphate dehydrogenase [NAD(P)+] n=1 Tax=Iodidimonas gelatinilytica TaxID=1236966 RepID=A0A5A7N1D0_9PROT|nr:NAD(P)H-dependent glycerol-3-phosphate dehydrogenase [Iodidimonas gelatinilytica]GER01525.1 glycerol-3-phosphate dehydrogenase [NAD(P)+] [Iodidimonas gelatinilytica]
MENKTTFRSIGILGGGAWGTALGCVSARKGQKTLLWARNEAVVADINHNHANHLYLPDIALEPRLKASTNIADLGGCDALLLVSPAQTIRHMALALRPHLDVHIPLIICAKGIEQETGALMSQVLGDVLPKNPVAVLSGPNFAGEVARDLPAAVTLACHDEALGAALVDAIGAPTFRPYYSPDVIGAQIGGAVKNVLAIACGMVAGLALGENARAALITRGLAEMTRFGLALGALRETMTGLSGVGDLILTCSSEQSRNMSLGKALGEGRKMADILAERRGVAEGAASAAVVQKLALEVGVDMPIVEAVATLLHSDADVGDVLKHLLSRPFRHEGI